MPVTARMPARTASTDGEANTSPQTAAVRRPFPTKPAWEGSWPEPPPDTRATFDLSQSKRTTTLMCGKPSSRASAPPEARTKPSTAWVTTVSLALMNCAKLGVADVDGCMSCPSSGAAAVDASRSPAASKNSGFSGRRRI